MRDFLVESADHDAMMEILQAHPDIAAGCFRECLQDAAPPMDDYLDRLLP